MKHLILLLSFAVCTHFADAQNNDWFKGSWDGIKSFTGARIGIRVLVRIEVDSIHGGRFFGRLIYMYPKDTIARLIKTFDGNIKGGTISLNKSKEIYLLDPRSRSFWPNCSQCNETGSLSLTDSSLFLKINTVNCGDSCNGETVFSRDVYRYDSLTQTTIKKFFSKDKLPVTARVNPKQKNKAIKPAKKNLADTIKNNQSLTKLNNKKAINTIDNTEQTVKSTSTFAVANKDSLSQPILNREVSETAHIDSQQKGKNIEPEKNGLADTIKNIEALTQLNSEKSSNITDSALITGESAQDLPVANTEPLPEAIKNRETDLVKTYQVDSPHIRVDLFDNGEIDSDIVSVYYNGGLIINHHTLTAEAITFNINASATDRHHEFILIAENEGSIPPNTALLRIIAGGKQYKLSVSTSGTKNAKIVIDYLGY